MVKIKSRNEILNDIIKDAKKHPKNWKAVYGRDNARLSRDYYICNPNTGIYLLKEYQKNPFEIQGIGGKIARQLDNEIENEIAKHSGDFGIIQGNVQKVLKNIGQGIPPRKILDAALKGKDLGIKMPVRGHISSSEDSYHHICDTLSANRKKLDSKFEKIASDNGLYDSYR